MFLENQFRLLLKDANYITVLPLAIFLFVGLSFMLNYHGVLYTNSMANDVVIFLDGYNRMKFGQLPYLDFSTGLGILNFAVSAWFAPISDHGGQAFLFYVTAVFFYMLVIAIYISVTRLNRFLAWIFLIYLSVLVVCPNLSTSNSAAITFAMFYNRFGWAALLLGVMLLLNPKKGTKTDFFVTSLVASSLLLFCLHTKITCFIALLSCYLLVLALQPKKYGTLAIGVVFFSSASALIMEIAFPGLHLSYFNELRAFTQANQGVDFDLLNAARKNGVGIILAVTAVIIASRGYEKPYYKQVTFYYTVWFVFISLFVVANSYSRLMMPGLYVLVAAALMSVAKCQVDDFELKKDRILLLCFITLAFTFPEISVKFSNIAKYYKETRRISDGFHKYAGLQGIYFKEGNADLLKAIEGGEPLTVEKYREKINHSGRWYRIYQSEYMYTLSEGAKRLEALQQKHGVGGVVNFDFSNIFNYALGIEPPKNDYICYHVGRNISSSAYMRAEKLFADAMYVAVPKFPAEKGARDFLLETYGDYLEKHYVQVNDGALWSFYRKI